jgi:hypothetical protein
VFTAPLRAVSTPPPTIPPRRSEPVPVAAGGATAMAASLRARARAHTLPDGTKPAVPRRPPPPARGRAE